MQRMLKVLESFDGKHAEPLVELAKSTLATEPNVQKLLALAEHDKVLVRAAATWILKRWHDGGVEFSTDTAAEMVRLLGQESEWGSQLHLVQMLTKLEIPKQSAAKMKAATTKLAAGENKFVRGWAVSALANLADQHPRYRKAAIEALAAAEQDAAASVKARVRKVHKQYAWSTSG